MLDFPPIDFARPALDHVVVMRGVPLRVWYAGPDRGGVWLVRPDGVMSWFANGMVGHLPPASAALAANAFPAVN